MDLSTDLKLLDLCLKEGPGSVDLPGLARHLLGCHANPVVDLERGLRSYGRGIGDLQTLLGNRTS